MIDKEKMVCNCKGCQEERAALERQLNNPFYKRVDEFREEVKREQFAKAVKKYNEPFNPDSWTGEELARHAMQENYDQSVYITGLMDRVVKQEKTIEFLLGTLSSIANHNHLAVPQLLIKEKAAEAVKVANEMMTWKREAKQ